SGTPNELVRFVFHPIIPLYGRRSEGASRTIIDDRQRLRPDALRPRMIPGVALRIALKAGSPRRTSRAVAASANFADSYQIDPDLSIIKCGYRNLA
ncbi:MAG TPA: hypothetical protein VN849_01135, partial [Stellaceae bacterium]|nr:hypothetical protein [Stellaceae bacterium]